MIQYIKGTLADMDEESVTIDNHGIGFQVYISGQTFEYLPELGADIKMYIYFQAKEDGLALFGFLTKDDLRVFKLLNLEKLLIILSLAGSFVALNKLLIA